MRIIQLKTESLGQFRRGRKSGRITVWFNSIKLNQIKWINSVLLCLGQGQSKALRMNCPQYKKGLTCRICFLWDEILSGQSLSSEKLLICSSSLSTCKRSYSWVLWCKSISVVISFTGAPSPDPRQSPHELTSSLWAGQQVSYSRWTPYFWMTHSRGSLSWFSLLSVPLLTCQAAL